MPGELVVALLEPLQVHPVLAVPLDRLGAGASQHQRIRAAQDVDLGTRPAVHAIPVVVPLDRRGERQRVSPLDRQVLLGTNQLLGLCGARHVNER